MSTSSLRGPLSLGSAGEQLAADYLRSQGLVVLYRGYRCPRGEIDLVCRDGNELVFVEVKSRSSLTAGYPAEAITRAKMRRIITAARYFIAEHGLERVPIRFDVIAIQINNADLSKAQITHHPYAFGVE